MPKKMFVRQAGNTLLNTPLLNKGSAFSSEERKSFNLSGLLPANIESIEEQASRAYEQFSLFSSELDKHIYLRNIQDTNETLYFKLIDQHIEEMMPIIYTPTVGDACQKFSQIYRRNRGLFLSYEEQDELEEILNNAPNKDVKVIVITDGERILGLGDQGIGGMGIPIGKLALYTACGGINPEHTLPIVLDVGTNNSALLSDPMYMGWRHPRVSGEQYYDFVDDCLKAIRQRWPDALIQFEDFAQTNAMPLLQRYQDKFCCFNDDIQGTASVTVGTLLAAANVTGKRLSQQKVVFAGAGSAGCGIAEAIIAQMVYEGISEQQAREQIFMVDRWGLLEQGMTGLLSFQQSLAQPTSIRTQWEVDANTEISLLDVIQKAKPDVLIGVTGVPGLFNQPIIEAMAAGCERPVVMPLSNPTSRVEAKPADIITWTDGRAIVATGSPFPDVVYKGVKYPIAQCNNSYIFPGIGLGVISANANRVTNEMLQQASMTLASMSPMLKGGKQLLPPLSDIQNVSRKIAVEVAKKAVQQGKATDRTEERLSERLEEEFWQAQYCEYRRIAS
ncbi:NAD-dependent malic enzyme [Vibrio diazotrophicus]|uniref:malate dehydrogenase (oxaloacetate-decarboxylating) n=1 Tax=Vibrio diazotrophicus TaxID=685 RepID=A0A2J8I5B5_VIBDI|nr:NAD-dependent malic enzyme [Vibrio diazotrophicus]PNI05708.1 NAD-dependent malic enzyme [Vibrio diazotrophicus]